MTYKEIGKILRQKRLEAGMTQKALAQLFEISQNAIFSYEKALTRIPIEFLQDFEALFSIPAGELSEHSDYHQKKKTEKREPQNNNEIAQLRVKCRLTQKEVAKIFHISRTGVQFIEQEKQYGAKLKQLVPQIKKYLRNLALVKERKVK